MFIYLPSARAESARPDFARFFGPMEALQSSLPVLSAAAEWNGKIFGIVWTLNEEWLDFANRRLAAHMALPQDLGACNSLQDVCSVYADFLEKAVTDYQKQFAEIAKPDVQAVSAPISDIHYASTSAGSDPSGRLQSDDDDHA
jgi:hypothetical protein